MTATLPRPEPTLFSLFSGIGGLELGLERAGMRVVGQVEKDPFCLQVLEKHWPEVPRHDDVNTAIEWWRSEPRPAVDVVAGGFPCQPVSEAGLGLAQADERWLWPSMAETIAALTPPWVIGENVPGLLRSGIDDVVRDLRRLGYVVRVGTIPACAMGATHTRNRVFVLAHTAGEGRCSRWDDRRSIAPQDVQFPDRGVDQRGDRWPSEPNVDRVAYGLSRGVDRRRALGNAVVPAVAEWIGRMIMPFIVPAGEQHGWGGAR